MITSLPKNILNPYINKISERCSFLYGINYSSLLKTKMHMIQDIEVTHELQEYTPMAFAIGARVIKINENYCEFDAYGKPISFVKSVTPDQYHSLIHELLHASSVKKSGCGIPYPKSTDNVGLNEGITQMMADDICGYVENKFLKSYNDSKIVAKILRTTLGNNVICESYFKESNILPDMLNNISKNDNYYEELNAKLNALNTLCISLFDTSGKYQANYELYDRKLRNIYKDIICNIVIPSIKHMDVNHKKEYLSSLMYDIGADDKLKNEIKTIIANLIILNDKELSEEKYKIQAELENFKNEDEFISLIKNDYERKNRIYVGRDGRVTLLGTKSQEITSPLQCKLIYAKIFENRYPNFSTNDAYQYLNEMKKGKPLNIRYPDILDRRVIFCGIQKKLFSLGYILINEYDEFDNSNSIRPILIHKSNNIIFDDLKAVSKKYGLFYKVDNKNDYNYSICDRNSFKKSYNINVVDIAKFANIWIHSITNSLDYNDKAFSEKYEKSYNIIIGSMRAAYNNTNNFDIGYMYKYCYTPESKEILKNLLSTSFKVETAFRFIQLIDGPSEVKQEFKGESYNQRINVSYDLEIARKDANDILKH